MGNAGQDLGSVDLDVANAPGSREAEILLLGSSGRIAASRDTNNHEAVFTAVPAPLPLAMMLAGIGAIALRRLG
jgi:hypothetical protein